MDQVSTQNKDKQRESDYRFVLREIFLYTVVCNPFAVKAFPCSIFALTIWMYRFLLNFHCFLYLNFSVELEIRVFPLNYRCVFTWTYLWNWIYSISIELSLFSSSELLCSLLDIFSLFPSPELLCEIGYISTEFSVFFTWNSMWNWRLNVQCFLHLNIWYTYQHGEWQIKPSWPLTRV